MFKRWLSASLILLAVCLGSNEITARADYSDALATAPQGILINKTNPFLTVDTTGKSSTSIVNGKNSETPGTQIARLHEGPYEFGAIWSTDSGYMDLKKVQKFSMWLYLGSQESPVSSGMAFVLQNDKAGLGALATSPAGKKTKLPSETLGVWAADNLAHQGSKVHLAETAIQNSWALEFDTRHNGMDGAKAAGQGQSFDLNEAPVHIASNYPAQSSTYVQHATDKGFLGGLLSKTDYHYSMVHQGVLVDPNNPDFLATGKWHHLSLRWDPKTEQMTYAFDDRDPATNNPLPGMRQTVHIDPKKIDPAWPHAKNDPAKVRWGFTSATGATHDDNLVIFENIPGLIVVDTAGEIIDVERKQVLSPRDQVVSGDELQVAYHLNYKSGRQTWADIRAKLRLPDGINYERAEIIYGNGKKQVLSLDEMTDRQLMVRLDQELSEVNDSAMINFFGKAMEVKETKMVPAVGSSFTSTARVASIATTQFRINPHADVDLQVISPSSVSLEAGQDTTVLGKVVVTCNGDMDMNMHTKVKAVLNDQPLADLKVNADGLIRLPLKAKQLKPGNNVLFLRAVTSHGDASHRVKVNIKVAGELKFAMVSPKENFQSGTLSGTPQLIKRAGNWKLAIQDTRGKDKRWSLSAQATPLMVDGKPAAGRVVYVDGDRRLSLTNTPTTVLTRSCDETVNDGKYEVTDDWKADTGVLLELNGGSKAGKYQTRITWSLQDAPQ